MTFKLFNNPNQVRHPRAPHTLVFPDVLTYPHCDRTLIPRLERKEYRVGDEVRAHLGAYCQGCGGWIKWLPQTQKKGKQS